MQLKGTRRYKVSDTVHTALKDSVWREKKAREILPLVNKSLTLRGAMTTHREHFRIHVESEYSLETLDYREAFERGDSKKSLYETYIRPDAPRELNLSLKNTVAPLVELAEQGRYEEMNLTDVNKSNDINISEPMGRFRNRKDVKDGSLLKSVMEQL